MSATLALSVTGLTIRAASIAGLAIFALLLTGWRKPARAEPRSPRGAARHGAVGGGQIGVVVDHFDTPAERRPGVARRVLAALASSAIGLLIGVLSAIVVSFAVAWAVIWLTNLLQQ